MVLSQQSKAAQGERARSHPASVRDYLERHAGELRSMLLRPGAAGVALAERHAQLADELLTDLYEAAADGQTPPLLMGAVGGYGRRRLGLRSDLDVCFVTLAEPERVAPLVEAVLYPLWDAGIQIGHQVINLSELVADAARDLPTATELLDFRPLSGDLTLWDRVREHLATSVFAEASIAQFIARLESHARARHEHFGDSVYLLEPDVKNGTGGLRDLDFALWAARARFGTGDLPALVTLSVLSPARLGETERAIDFVWTVRNHLHQIAGRRSDRLTFGEQETVARALGYGAAFNAREGSELSRTGAMVEAFMSDYYRHARAIARARDQLLGSAKRRTCGTRPPQIALGNGFVTCEGRIGLADPSELYNEPTLALRVYKSAVAHEMKLLSRTREAICEATSDPAFCQQLRKSPEAAQLFVKLVCSCRPVVFESASILSELHDVGIVLALIPEFAPVVGRVHNDLYHVYTVDVHSIAAVDRLRQLTCGELAERYPLACRLAAEVTRPEVVFMATLLHDVGKAIGGQNHAQRGAEMARVILKRLGLDGEDIEDACHLILKHLCMYVVAARRDLGDPATIAEFVREVRGREGLRDLYLLTVADVSTTSPVSMTKWKASMLDGLFRGSDALLSGDKAEGPSRIARVCADVHALWHRDDHDALRSYLGSMPERYLLSNTPQEIAAHAALALGPREAAVACAVVPSRVEDVMELCVVTEARSQAGLCVVASDRPGLLASISAAISANRLEIQAAQVHSRALSSGDYQAVDLFWVRGDSEDDFEVRLAKLQRDLTAVVEGQVAPSTLIRPRSTGRFSQRPSPPVRTEVLFDHRGSTHHTIIEVLTQDRPALLFTLAQALHSLGISISVAKISTEGRRAIDVFYVTETDGSKLTPGARTEEVRSTLLSALQMPSQTAN